jgi:NADH-quinone oxidoreductase subunit G
LPKITIDDIELEVEAGQNIIQAASGIGIEIPHFCYHPSLSVVAQCRQCLVEVDGVPKVLPACNTFVRDGLVVKTNSEKAVKAREATVEFTLINHPLDCPICDKGGECPLQLTTFKHGPGYSRVEGPQEKKVRQKIYLSNRIMYDPNRCIMCTRCMRFTDEITETKELGTIGRGFRKKIAVFPGKELNNELAGNVIDLCPVGALLDKETLHEERVWYMEFTDSVCSLCSNGCNITIGVDPRIGKVSRIRPRPNPNVNDYWICDNGRYGFKEVQEQNRLREPIIKNGEEYENSTWEESINLFHNKVSEVIGLSHLNLGIVVSPTLTNEELYLATKLRDKFHADQLVSNIGFNSGTKKFNIISSDPYPNSQGVKDMDISTNLRDIIQSVIDKKIDALFVIGEDLLGYVEEPNLTKLKEALSSLTFLAVLDTKLTGTAHFADFIFPGATAYEKDGTFTNDRGRVQQIRAAIPPPGSAKPEWEVLNMIGKKFDEFGFNFTHPSEIMADLSGKNKFFRGISYDRVGVLGSAAALEN